MEFVASAKNMALRRDAILRRLPKTPAPLVVEVGVSSGTLAHGLLEGRGDLRWIGVDSWRCAADQPERYVETLDGHASMPREQADYLKALAFERTSGYGDRASIKAMDSLHGAALFPDGSADLVFIDADHSYEGALEDCLAWHPKVRPGGWVGGHDFRVPKGFRTDVERAVREFSERVGRPFEMDQGNTWWLKCP